MVDMTRVPSRVVLRSFTVADESQALAAHEELAGESFGFLLDYDVAMSWPAFLERLGEMERGEDLAPDRVQAALLAADVDGTLVGRSSIRFGLNDWLTDFGGHIGYAVRPQFRHHGYGSAILRESLRICADAGVREVLLTCADANAASIRLIEDCGGVFEDRRVRPDGQEIRRYWVNTKTGG